MLSCKPTENFPRLGRNFPERIFKAVDFPIPLGPYFKILGVTLDGGLTFRHHIAYVTFIAKNWLNVMKALTSITFGQFQESLNTLYR